MEVPADMSWLDLVMHIPFVAGALIGAGITLAVVVIAVCKFIGDDE